MGEEEILAGSPCLSCENRYECRVRFGCDAWKKWLTRPKKRKICEECGSVFYHDGKARFCPTCKERRRREQQNNAIRTYVAPTAHAYSKPKYTIAQYNTMMRERGRTYGGKVILQASPLEPKFMAGCWPAGKGKKT